MNRFVALSAEFLADEEAGDTAQPGAEMRGLAELGKLFPRGDKRILGKIFAEGQAARGVVGDRADERLIPLDDLTEGIAVTRQAPLDQLCVAVHGRRHCRGCHHITV